jgi:hypothetical protein
LGAGIDYVHSKGNNLVLAIGDGPELTNKTESSGLSDKNLVSRQHFYFVSCDY